MLEAFTLIEFHLRTFKVKQGQPLVDCLSISASISMQTSTPAPHDYRQRGENDQHC